MSKVITANDLATGLVVFLGNDDRWVDTIDQASSYADAAAAELALDRVTPIEKALVVDPFATDVKPGTDGRPSMTLRDRIRAYGPTIQFLPADQGGA